MELEELIRRYPRLYHMAERDTWQSIRVRGLLSTSAVLDNFGISGAARVAIERRHRPEKVTIGSGKCSIVLRDQKPMHPDRLRRALPAHVSPLRWYRLLNKLVFMWAEKERLLKLLNARQYRKLEHDVLTIDAAPFLRNYEQSIWLAHMNSGNTFPKPHARDIDLFKRIADYPTKKSGGPAKTVVEVVTDYAIPDVRKYVVSVDRMRGDTLLHHIHP